MNAAALELRERTARIRAAARKGKTTAEIAEAYTFSLRMVEQVLAPVPDVRLSDPAQLLNNRAIAAGLPAAETQVYWVGFLTAAGWIRGQGASCALVVTLGDRSEEYMATFMADLATPQLRHEFCRSSLLGWQLYVRDQNLCKMMVRWGIPSELHGDDPAVLDDLPEEFIAPFLRGYVDGQRAAPAAAPRPSTGLLFWGTEAVLTAVNAMVHRGWYVESGVVTPRPPRAELRFDRQDAQAILNHIGTYTARSRGQIKHRPT